MQNHQLRREIVLNLPKTLLEKISTLETRFAELDQKYKSVSETPQKDNNDEKSYVNEAKAVKVRDV